MEKKRDTKKLLIESLLDLSKTIPTDKITVRDIVENSGVGRQTFYNHFRDKYDLIDYFYSSKVDSIIRSNMQARRPWIDSIIDVLVFFQENKQFFKSAIIENGQLAFFSIYYEHTRNAYISFITDHSSGSISDEMLFQVEFNCYGAVNMVRKWLLNNMDSTPQALGNNIWNAMPAEMKQCIIKKYS